jgi:3-hydroxyacyl-CoA dehydrogenase/enoyl-CoA hydratase/3-hydroxybutyryl-CoA epimerase
MFKNLRFEVDADGVALISLDVADRPMNVITSELLAELREVVTQIGLREEVHGAVITSGKNNAFVAGADLKDFVGVYAQGVTPAQAAATIAEGAQILRDLECCGKPVAAAINGLALGGGYEVCLACHYRVIVDDRRAVVGLPEVTVGLLPGGGGTQRLPRLIGIERALPLLLSGRHVGPDEALSLGLVDAVVPADDLVSNARRWVLDHPGAQQPWDIKGYRVPGGVGALAAHANGSFGTTLAQIRRDTHDNYPAPLAILAAVYEGTQLPIDRGVHVESKFFGPLLAGPVARNLMRTMFLNLGAAQKLARRPAGVPRQRVQRLGVLGAGTTGSSIAHVAATSDIDVVLIDATQAAAEAGKVRIAAQFAHDQASGLCTSATAEARLARITASADFALLRGCDFVIEAEFDNHAIKANFMARAADALCDVPENFVWASSTSTPSINALATDWRDPQQVIGLHFVSTETRVPLVEVVLGAHTAPATLARAMDLVQQLRKTPIVVNDSPGLYTSRIFWAYIDEGMAMLAEGVAPTLIENAARQAGFTAGPLEAIDEVSLDVQKRAIDQAMADGMATRLLRGHAQPVIERMLALGRRGREHGGGFHDFPEASPKRLWHGLCKEYPLLIDQPAVDEVKQRLLCVQALEAARCVEEGVVPDVADVDLGAVLGLGYPTWTGGPLSYMETVGLKPFVAICDRFAERYGERFRPSSWLRERAQTEISFYEIAQHDR